MRGLIAAAGAALLCMIGSAVHGATAFVSN